MKTRVWMRGAVLYLTNGGQKGGPDGSEKSHSKKGERTTNGEALD